MEKMIFKYEMKKSEPASLHMLYQSHYETLVKQRDELIAEIEDINQQIVELKKEAQEKGMPLNSFPVESS